MPEHHTRQVTTDKLEEADKTLSQDNSTLNNKIDTIHASLIAKIEALFIAFASSLIFCLCCIVCC